MSLHHAVLGFLSTGRASRSELVAAFQWSVGPFWTADKGEFKRVLDRSVETGLVAREPTSAAGMEEDPAYRLTMQGQAVLDEWLVSPEERYPLRESFLLRLFFVGRLEPAIIGRLVENHIDATSERLAELQKINAEIGQQLSRAELPFEDRLRLSTLDRGIAFTEAELTWAESLRSELAGNVDPGHSLASSH